MAVHIGTSGWSYKHWVGAFYPFDLPQSKHFEHYCEHFSTVEINSTFYHLPNEKTFANWGERTPEKFIFSIKASRYITHIKRLLDIDEPVARLLHGCSFLGEKMGHLLFQLPPGLKKDEARLSRLLQLLPKTIKPVLEFRHPSWFDSSVYDILEKHAACFCWHDFRQMECPQIVTAKTVYLRLHGPDGHYNERYPEKYLEKLAEKINEYHDKKFQVYVYFNNDFAGYAVENAKRLKELIS